MKITVIDNFDSFVYNLVRYLREIPTVEVSVQRNNAIDYDQLDNADAILLSPGPGIPSEAGDLMQVIERYAERTSMLGVCLGHQALAEHFGGQLYQCEAPIHGKPSNLEQSSNSTLFNGIPSTFQAGRYHSWSVARELPDCLKETAHFETELMAFEHATAPVFGVQFHPESILTPHGRQMMQNWVTASTEFTIKTKQQ